MASSIALGTGYSISAGWPYRLRPTNLRYIIIVFQRSAFQSGKAGVAGETKLHTPFRRSGQWATRGKVVEFPERAPQSVTSNSPQTQISPTQVRPLSWQNLDMMVIDPPFCTLFFA